VEIAYTLCYTNYENMPEQNKALILNDLSKLTPEERQEYVNSVCATLGITPLTKPFAFLKNRNGDLVLYALKDCTEQLRSVHGISIQIISREIIDGTYVVTAKASKPDGRCDESTGAVAVEGKKGDDKANAIMKAETKAKRRVTLSICGLGLLDESEIESVRGMAPMEEPEFIVRSTEPTSELRREEKTAAAPVSEQQPSHVSGETTTSGEPQNLRSQLKASMQRLTVDLNIPKGKSKVLFDSYFQGFMDIPEDDPLPKQPERYQPALLILDLLSLLDHDATADKMQYAPKAFGVLAAEHYSEWFDVLEDWNDAVCSIGFRVAKSFGFSEFSELAEYLKANKINLSQPDDVSAFLRLALLDRDLATEMAAMADSTETPPSFILEEIERKLKGQVESFSLPAIKDALAVAVAI
jgi:hypothetical protein